MPGHIISLIGAKDGVGKSQVAANLAFAFAKETRNRALLLDFDQKAGGDLALITGMRSKKNLKELSQFSGQFDPRTLQLFTAQHKLGVMSVNMDSDTIAAQQINVEGLGKLLKSCTQIFPITIIDVGSELTPLALKALEASTLILGVVTPDLLVLNQTKRLFKELSALMFPKEMVHFVVNSLEKGNPLSTEMMAKQIGKNLFGALPRDTASCNGALARGKSAAEIAPSGAFFKSVQDLARKIMQKGVLQSLAKLNRPQNVESSHSKGSQANQVSLSLDEKSARAWTALKARIHRALVEEMDLSKAADSRDEQSMLVLREQTKRVVVDLLEREETKSLLNSREKMNQMVKEILDEALGLGPLEDLLANKEVSEVMVVGPDKIYYEQKGKIKLSTITFTNDRQVLNVIERIVAPIGRRIDEKTPYVDARLRDGSRVHAIIPPCAIDGCTITIRKFPENVLTHKDLIGFSSLSAEMADFLRIAVESHRNIIVSGGTGSGKTTLINVLSSFIPANERIVTCEDSAELSLPQEHVVRLETRPPSLDGTGGIDIRQLVKQTLRMRPDRVVVGECRGGETLDMLQAMNTGHDGSLTTVHSNSPRDCLSRLETLVQYSGAGISPKAIKEMIASAVHIVVQQSRLDDGSRRITHISEVGGMQGDVITLQDIFVFKQEGTDKTGKIFGKFQATGFIPQFIEKLERKGLKIPRGIFTNG